MLKIGPINVDPGILLAPMEDVSELPFRLICKELGADIVYTEFVNAEGLLREDPQGPRRSFRKLNFLEKERPMGIQLYGAASLSMEKATEIASAQNPDLIDINCGCWVSNVALRGAGAGLLRDLPQMKQIVSRVVGATHLPVTVKTRLGWDQDSIRIVEVAKMLEDVGVQALAIHCRTPHGSQPNRSDSIRWSMDLRWNDARMPNGRPHLPGLYVRSQESPELVVHEREEWLTAWKFARASSRGARSYRWI